MTITIAAMRASAAPAVNADAFRMHQTQRQTAEGFC